MKYLMLFFLYSSSVVADEYLKIKYEGVYDGDTIYTSMKLPSPLNKLSVRLYGIDTPEKGGRANCTLEAVKAEEAKAYLRELIGFTKYIYIKDYKWDKFGGRILGDAYTKIDGKYISLRQKMIKKGHAIEYYGEKKEHDWCKK